jgi:hypothetical protein
MTVRGLGWQGRDRRCGGGPGRHLEATATAQGALPREATTATTKSLRIRHGKYLVPAFVVILLVVVQETGRRFLGRDGGWTPTGLGRHGRQGLVHGIPRRPGLGIIVFERAGFLARLAIKVYLRSCGGCCCCCGGRPTATAAVTLSRSRSSCSRDGRHLRGIGLGVATRTVRLGTGRIQGIGCRRGGCRSDIGRVCGNAGMPIAAAGVVVGKCAGFKEVVVGILLRNTSRVGGRVVRGGRAPGRSGSVGGSRDGKGFGRRSVTCTIASMVARVQEGTHQMDILQRRIAGTAPPRRRRACWGASDSMVARVQEGTHRRDILRRRIARAAPSRPPRRRRARRRASYATDA